MSETITDIKWRKGSRFTQLDPSKSHDALEQIRAKNNGEIDPECVVSVAANPKHYLHKAFEWDDTIAAKRHRETVARTLIRSIIVVRAEAPKVEARRYEVSVQASVTQSKPRNVYRTTADILQDPDSREVLLSRAIRELAALRERYHGLSELAKVFQAADEAFAKYAG